MRHKVLTTTAILATAGAAATTAQAGVPVNVGAGGSPTVVATNSGAAAVAWPVEPPGETVTGTQHCLIPRGTVTIGCLSGGLLATTSIDEVSHVVRRADGNPSIVYREPETGPGHGRIFVSESNDGGATYGAPSMDPSNFTAALDLDSEVAPWLNPTQHYLVAAGTDSTSWDTFDVPSGGGGALDLFGTTIGGSVGVGLANDLLRVADIGGGALLQFTRNTAGIPTNMASWTPPVGVPGTNGTSDPKLVSAGAGKAAVLGYQRGPFIEVMRSTGPGFDSPTLVTPASGGAEWDITRDATGRLHVVYYRPGFGTFWQFSNDNGLNWSAPLAILPASQTPLSLEVSAAPDGSGWIAYKRLDGFVFVASLDPNPIVSPPTPPPPPPPGAGGGGDAAKFPAKLRVRRAGVKDGRLDILAEITARATGKLELELETGGRKHRFEVTIPDDGVMKIDEKLPKAMRNARSGILEIDYDGNDRVRPDDVRLRAANRKANLERDTTTLKNGRLKVDGTISERARGVVRVRLGYVDTDNKVKFLRLRAKIDDGKWELNEKLTGAAAKGGQLSIQFTGYLPARMRGEQTAKQVLPSS